MYAVSKIISEHIYVKLGVSVNAKPIKSDYIVKSFQKQKAFLCHKFSVYLLLRSQEDGSRMGAVHDHNPTQSYKIYNYVTVLWSNRCQKIDAEVSAYILPCLFGEFLCYTVNYQLIFFFYC